MRKFRLCSKHHNAQYTSTKIKAKPVRTDTAMQEMLANSFLISARKELCLKDLPWYACNRGLQGSLVQISSRDLKIHMGGAIRLTTALSVSVLPSGGVVRITTSLQLLSTYGTLPVLQICFTSLSWGRTLS